MRLITVNDQDDGEYDLHFIIPANIETDEAIKIVDAAVIAVKDNEDYTFDDLEARLSPLGFTVPFYYTANERW